MGGVTRLPLHQLDVDLGLKLSVAMSTSGRSGESLGDVDHDGEPVASGRRSKNHRQDDGMTAPRKLNGLRGRRRRPRSLSPLIVLGSICVQPRAAGIFTEAQVPYDGPCKVQLRRPGRGWSEIKPAPNRKSSCVTRTNHDYEKHSLSSHIIRAESRWECFV